MPSMMGSGMQTHTLAGRGFNFSATRVDQLGATNYTIVDIGCDATGSMTGYEPPAVGMIKAAVDACRKSPRSDNLLIRVLLFSDRFPNGVEEIHGYKPLSEIDTSAYSLIASGLTPLCDACYSALGAANAYAKQLTDQDYSVNGISFVITDGGENASTATMRMVREEAEKAVKGEFMESHVSVLVGIDTGGGSPQALQRFATDAGFTQFVDAGAATPQRLAKLAAFVSRSVSSQSQSLGTGGPSQQIAATI